MQNIGEYYNTSKSTSGDNYQTWGELAAAEAPEIIPTATRTYLGRLSPYQRTTLQSHLERTGALEALNLHREKGRDQAQPVDQLAAGSDDTLRNLWEWNTTHTRALNMSSDRHDRTALARKEFETKVMDAVVGKALPESATDAMESYRQNTRVYHGDVFDTGLNNSRAYAIPRRGVMVFAEGFDNHDFSHESCHIISRFPFAPLLEAVDEHMSVGLINEDLATITPNPDDGSVYVEDRSLLDLLSRSGMTEVPARSYIDAAFEKNPQGPAFQKLLDQQATAYGGREMFDFMSNAAWRCVEHLRQVMPSEERHDANIQDVATIHAANHIQMLGLQLRGAPTSEIDRQLNRAVNDKAAQLQQLEAAGGSANSIERARVALEANRLLVTEIGDGSIDQ